MLPLGIALASLVLPSLNRSRGLRNSVYDFLATVSFHTPTL